MIGKGSLVRFIGKDKRIPYGKYLGVHERNGNSVTVWHTQKSNGKWSTIKLNIKDIEEVC